MEGLCIYPILNHPGWDDDRHCHNGLFDYAEVSGNREVFVPLADELTRQRGRFQSILAGGDPGDQTLDTSALDWAAHTMEDRTDESRSTE